jgi:hypothetical protein
LVAERAPAVDATQEIMRLIEPPSGRRRVRIARDAGRPDALALALAVLALFLGYAAGPVTAGRGRGLSAPLHHAASARPKRSLDARVRRAAPRLLIGIADEHPSVFRSSFWKRLHVGIARYVVPYDVVAHRRELLEARQWIGAAISAHQQILVAFYHSQQVPMRMPSAALYRSDVAKFLRRFPQVHEYQPWNEADRGYVPGYFASPSPMQSAIYYRELRGLAHHDTVLGLDILDSWVIAPTLRYVTMFKHDIRELRVPMPDLWGLHNYSDTNAHQSIRTRAVLATVPGNVWLTETGGVVHFDSALTNVHGSGLRRAGSALEYMFRLAYVSPRVKRLYIYNWYGTRASARFDAGIMDRFGHPRRGYVIVCDYLLHYSKRCHVHVNND